LPVPVRWGGLFLSGDGKPNGDAKADSEAGKEIEAQSLSEGKDGSAPVAVSVVADCIYQVVESLFHRDPPFGISGRNEDRRSPEYAGVYSPDI
jgi:hypothetical protein